VKHLCLLSLLAALALLPACAGDGKSASDLDAGDGTDTGTSYANEVQPGIYELAGNDPTLPHDDLAPLDVIIGDARAIALGESTHTSGGYYKMKHRLFRYLAEELGFRAFAFETPWTDADIVADYVQTGTGNAETAVAQGLF
jgi:erythromycin esterase